MWMTGLLFGTGTFAIGWLLFRAISESPAQLGSPAYLVTLGQLIAGLVALFGALVSGIAGLGLLADLWGSWRRRVMGLVRPLRGPAARAQPSEPTATIRAS